MTKTTHVLIIIHIASDGEKTEEGGGKKKKTFEENDTKSPMFGKGHTFIDSRISGHMKQNKCKPYLCHLSQNTGAQM